MSTSRRWPSFASRRPAARSSCRVDCRSQSVSDFPRRGVRFRRVDALLSLRAGERAGRRQHAPRRRVPRRRAARSPLRPRRCSSPSSAARSPWSPSTEAWVTTPRPALLDPAFRRRHRQPTGRGAQRDRAARRRGTRRRGACCRRPARSPAPGLQASSRRNLRLVMEIRGDWLRQSTRQLLRAAARRLAKEGHLPARGHGLPRRAWATLPQARSARVWGAPPRRPTP